MRAGEALQLGVAPGADIRIIDTAAAVRPTTAWLGRIIDAFGNPIDGKGPLPQGPAPYPLRAAPPAAHSRGRVGERLDLNAGCKLAAQAFCPILFFALKRLRGPVSAGDAQALSEREREVLQWIALGKQQAEVAAILMISERTVENHLRAARRRLGAASTAQAVARALRLGDIEV